ncbi:MAG: hypothetical protein ACW964_05975 [Candidatus Hodarchaeales archaeon]|jgi:hypothetical protein
MINIATPLTPGTPIFHSGLGTVTKTFVSSNYAYTLDENGLISIINVSDPTNSVLLSQFLAGATATNIYVKENLLFVSVSGLGILIYDLSNKSSLSEVTVQQIIPIDGNVFELVIEKDIAYIACGDHGLVIIEVSDFIQGDPTTTTTTMTPTATTTSTTCTTSTSTTVITSDNQTPGVNTTTTSNSIVLDPTLELTTTGFTFIWILPLLPFIRILKTKKNRIG